MRPAVALVIVGLLAAPCAYSQDVPKGIAPAKGSYFCEIDVTWPGESGPSPAIGRIQRIADSEMLVSVGKRHAYSFPTMEESWDYVSDVVVMAVSGSQYGDDVVDAFTYRNRTRSWDEKQHKSEIGQQELRFFNAVAKRLVGCQRTLAKK